MTATPSRIYSFICLFFASYSSFLALVYTSNAVSLIPTDLPSISFTSSEFSTILSMFIDIFFYTLAISAWARATLSFGSKSFFHWSITVTTTSSSWSIDCTVLRSSLFFLAASINRCAIAWSSWCACYLVTLASASTSMKDSCYSRCFTYLRRQSFPWEHT